MCWIKKCILFHLSHRFFFFGNLEKIPFCHDTKLAVKSRVRKSRYWEEILLSPIHCCDVTKPPYLLSGELCTSPLHSNRFYVYTVCCRRGGQCFSVLRTRHTDVVGDSSGRSYVTEQGHNVPLLRTRELNVHWNHTVYVSELLTCHSIFVSYHRPNTKRCF